MKIKLMSDLHVDTQVDHGRSLINSIRIFDHDVTVVAGDICQADDTDLYFEAISLLADRFRQVLVVPGNHEYWGGQAQAIDLAIDEVIGTFNNVKRLKPGFSEKVNGINIWGGTMWFGPTENWERYRGHMPDFSQIGNFVPWVFNENAKFYKMFEDNLVQPGDVVVSHHLPSFTCVDPKWAGSNINRFFVSQMDHYIQKYEPAAWLFGHTHDKMDFMLNKTRLVCNPFGYMGEFSNDIFDEKLIIEIGEK